MTAENLNDLRAFTLVAREKNFTRAAGQLDMSRSGLSHAKTALKARLGVRLLTRTTRSVSLTQAGVRLFSTLHAANAEHTRQRAGRSARPE